MATRTITWKQWLTAIRRNALGDGFGEFAGKPAADAAKHLGVSEQRISLLVADGRLDTIEVTTAKGTVAVRLITDASLAAYVPRASGYPGHLRNA